MSIDGAIVHVRLPVEVTDAVERCAKRDGITQTEFIRRALSVSIFAADERAQGKSVTIQVISLDGPVQRVIWPWDSGEPS